MGIKNLHTFIKQHAPHIYNTVKLSDYRGKKIAIDISIYLYKYKSLYRNKWFNSFLNMLVAFRKYNITPVFIYDTKSPIEKQNKKQERRNRKINIEKKIKTIEQDLEQYERTGEVSNLLTQINMKRQQAVYRLLPNDTPFNKHTILTEMNSLRKQIINVYKADITLTKDVLGMLNIPFFNAEMEGETLCAHLCCRGKVDAVLSDDTDVLVYGTPMFLTRLDLGKYQVQEIDYNKLIEHLEMNFEMFRDFCIMCGTDYNKNIFRIGHQKAHKLIKSFDSIEGIKEGKPEIDISILNHEAVRNIFSVPEHLDEKYNVLDEVTELKYTDTLKETLTEYLKEKDIKVAPHMLGLLIG